MSLTFSVVNSSGKTSSDSIAWLPVYRAATQQVLANLAQVNKGTYKFLPKGPSTTVWLVGRLPLVTV